MNATDLARRINDNLSWAQIVGPGHTAHETPSPRSLWSQLEAIWTDPERQFVARLYPLLLGRAPDAVGLANGVAALRGGTPRAVVVRALALSAEARSGALDTSWLPRLEQLDPDPVWNRVKALWHEPDGALVEGLYLLLLGRPADPEGLAHYCAQLTRGCSRATVTRRLARSAEARSRGTDVSWLPRLRTLPAPPGARPHGSLIAALKNVVRRLSGIRPQGLWASATGRRGRVG